VTVSYLPPGLPTPAPANDRLDEPYWTALGEERLMLQFCRKCDRCQWGPEWICHRCHSFDLEYRTVEHSGLIFSYERVWHPVNRALAGYGPYLIVLVELPHADGVRLVGNLLGNPHQEVRIGQSVRGVFEHHSSTVRPYTLLQWMPD
jgi:uncharacterized protein